VEPSLADHGREGALVGVVRRWPRWSRRRAEDPDLQAAYAEDLPLVRLQPPHTMAMRLVEQPPEVRVGRAVAVLEQRGGGYAREHLVQPALVVPGLMRGDHEVEPADPCRAQLAVHPRLGRAAVEQHRGSGAILDQRGVALADVEKRDGE